VIRVLSLSSFLMLTSSLVYAQMPAAGGPVKVALYAAVGHELIAYILNVDTAQLVKQASVTLPQNVQEAWPHPSRRHLYVTWSNNVGGKAGPPWGNGISHRSCYWSPAVAWTTDFPAARSVFITVDPPGNHILIAYNEPSGMTVHRISTDGTLGAEVPQPAGS